MDVCLLLSITNNVVSPQNSKLSIYRVGIDQSGSRQWTADNRKKVSGPQIKNGSPTLWGHRLGKDLTPTNGEELKDHGIAACGETERLEDTMQTLIGFSVWNIHCSLSLSFLLESRCAHRGTTESPAKPFGFEENLYLEGVLGSGRRRGALQSIIHKAFLLLGFLLTGLLFPGSESDEELLGG